MASVVFAGEQLRWQRQAVRVLAGLLERAGREGLPPVSWTVSSAGAQLLGQCDGFDAAKQRAAFEAWCRALGVAARPERTDGFGMTRLVAVRERFDGLVGVVLLAEIDTSGEE
jgi:hypothetical protein